MADPLPMNHFRVSPIMRARSFPRNPRLPVSDFCWQGDITEPKDRQALEKILHRALVEGIVLKFGPYEPIIAKF